MYQNSFPVWFSNIQHGEGSTKVQKVEQLLYITHISASIRLCTSLCIIHLRTKKEICNDMIWHIEDNTLESVFDPKKTVN